MIIWLVRCYNEFEVQANRSVLVLFLFSREIFHQTFHSLERIQSYLDIDHEPKATEAGRPPAAWPNSGELKVDGLSARYSAVS